VSGFVISRSLLSKTSFDFVDLIKFWLKRCSRLLPSAWLWLAIYVFLTLVFNSSGAFGLPSDAWSGLVAGVLQVANFKMAECFSGNGGCRGLGVYWSLSLEEQFYIFFPLVLYFFRKHFIILIVFLLFTQLFIPALHLPFYLRVEGLFLGVLIGYFSYQKGYEQLHKLVTYNKVYGVLGLVTFSGLLYSIKAPNVSIMSVFYTYKLVALVSAILVFIASFDKNLFQIKFISKISSWFGSRSYSIYLIHMPVMFAVLEFFYRRNESLDDVYNIYLLSSFLVVTFLLSELNYRCVETPIRDKGRAFASRMNRK
jgi:peptidoglycan/LPS O-acetylase OafA/YrhL